LKTLVVLLPILLLETLSSQPKNELRFSALVSQAKLQQTVRDLVTFGNRQGGTPSGDKAATYVQKQFKSMGLKTEVLDDPERLNYTNVSWKLDVVRPSALKGVSANAWLAGFSPTVKLRRARLVSLVAGNDIDNTNTDSAAVLVEGDQVDHLYSRLAAKGAACVLSWTEPRSKAYLDCAMVTSLPASTDNPIPLFDISRKSAHALLKKLTLKQDVTIEFSAKTRIAKGSCR
jgi:hypothetical protein